MSQLFGGICPLGTITVTTHGTPVQATTNVGSQQQGGAVSIQNPQGRPYSGNCRQLIFSTPTANTGDILIQDGQFAALGVHTLLIIPKGTKMSLPDGGEICDSIIDITRIWVDALNDGDKVVVTAVDAS